MQPAKNGLKKILCLILICAFLLAAGAAFAASPADDIPAEGNGGPPQNTGVQNTETEEAAPKAAVFAMPKDETNDVEQLELLIPELWYINGAGQAVPVPKTGGSFDLSGVRAEDIGGLRLRLDFNVLKNGDQRGINEGDTFRFEIPNLFTIADTPAPQEMTGPGGVTVAAYEIQGGVLTATFAAIVDNPAAEDITGGCDLDFSLKDGALSQGSTTAVTLPLQSTPTGNTGVEVVFPKISVPDGVEKSGEYDPQTGRVTWTVAVGTKTPGASMDGYRVTDTPGADQAFFSAEVKKDGAFEDIPAFAADGYSYAFPAGSKAPQTLRIVTEINKSVFTASYPAGLPVAANTAELSKDGTPAPADAQWKGTGKVTVPIGRVDKTGQQVSANKIGWTVTANENKIDGKDASNTILDAAVEDTLSAELTLDEVSLTLKAGNGTAQKVPVNPVVPAAPYATLDGGNRLTVYLGDISGKCTLYFETSMENGIGTGAAPTVENSASLTGRLPFGDGGAGYPVAGSIGPVSSDFSTAHIAKTAGAFDYAAGELLWTVKPSVRMAGYDLAVITDTVRDDQQYVEGSVRILDAGRPAGAQELTPDEVAGILAVNGKELTFTFGDPAVAPNRYLDDITIEYRTRALNYFKENGVSHKYENTAKLTVKSGGSDYTAEDTADKWVTNHLLQKTAAYVFDDAGNKGYMHYEIMVNGDGTNLGSVLVSDDLSGYDAATRILDLDGNDITSEFPAPQWRLAEDKFRVEDVTDGVESMPGLGIGEGKTTFSGGVLRVPLGDLQKKHIIHIYMELQNRDAFLKRNVEIVTENSATATADEFTCPEKTFSVTAPGPAPQDAFINDLVDKKSIRYDKDGVPAGILWEVRLNPNGAALGECVLEDTVPKGMEFDYGSVELYVSTHTGAAVSGVGAKVPETGYKVEIVKNADGSSAMKVVPPQDGRAYTLRYQTNITGPVADTNVKNNARLTSGGVLLAEDYAVQAVGGNAWANLTWKAAHQIYKYDADAGEAVPVPGAVYGIFTHGGADGAPLKTGMTDSDGKIMFWALERDTVYDLKELAPPEGYALDPAIYTFTTSADAYDPAKVVPQAVPEQRSAAAVRIRKADALDPSAGIAGTVFTLCRTMDGTAPEGVPVGFSGSPGAYTYTGAGADMDGTGLATGGDGRLVLDGLPWDDYCLYEKCAADGYLLDAEKRYRFTVNPDGTVAFDSASGISAVGTVLNDPTRVEILKTDEKGVPLAGARLALEDARGKTVETWLSSREAKMFSGRLAAGASYTVRELSAPDGYAAAQPVSFTVGMDGGLQTVTVKNMKLAADAGTPPEGGFTKPGTGTGDPPDVTAPKPTGLKPEDTADPGTASPKTGDTRDISPYIPAAVLLAGGIAALLVLRKKQKRFS